MILLHVTPTQNLESIASTGIDPTKSRGKQNVAWVIDEENILWAIAHVSMRHVISTRDIAVIQCSIDRELITRTRWKSVFTCATLISPSRLDKVMSAAYWIMHKEPKSY